LKKGADNLTETPVPIYAAWHPRWSKILLTPWTKPDITDVMVTLYVEGMC
jgi:hypothetical protein